MMPPAFPLLSRKQSHPILLSSPVCWPTAPAAVQYAAKDAERKAAIEAKNEADSLIYSGGCSAGCP